MPAAASLDGIPQPGDILAGRYRVEKIIGAGGMGCVLAAEHLLLRTHVALKLLLPQAAAWPGATERFLREAQAAAALRGEHVARVVDMGTIESGAPFLVMELLDGCDLAKVIQERAPLPAAEAVDYLLQIGDAVQEAHSLGILHRDLKPANLFVTTRPNGTPLLKVLDFGLAKVKAPSDGATPEANVTQTGQVIGSPYYMPPEQFRGLKHADARSDIWALGVVLYEMLTSRRPFSGEGPSGVMAAIFSDDPVLLGTLRPDIPPPLCDAVMSCLSKRPDGRPQSVRALLSALEPFAKRVPVANTHPHAVPLLSDPESGLEGATLPFAPRDLSAVAAQEAYRASIPAMPPRASDVSTSASMGVSLSASNAVRADTASPSGPIAPTIDMTRGGPAPNEGVIPGRNKSVWIAGGSIVAAGVVVGVVVRAVLTGAPSSDPGASGELTGTPILAASPAVSTGSESSPSPQDPATIAPSGPSPTPDPAPPASSASASSGAVAAVSSAQSSPMPSSTSAPTSTSAPSAGTRRTDAGASTARPPPTAAATAAAPQGSGKGPKRPAPPSYLKSYP